MTFYLILIPLVASSILSMYLLRNYYIQQQKSLVDEIEQLKKEMDHLLKSSLQTDINYKKELDHLAANNKNLQSWANSLQDKLTDTKDLYEKKLKEIEPKIREDAIKRSKQVNKGLDTEAFSPWKIPNLNPKDFRHLGNPIDFVVFQGADDIRSDRSDIVDCIYLIDIKTGEADLNKTQRRIRDAIVNSRICFLTYNPDTDEVKKWQPKDSKQTQVKTE